MVIKPKGILASKQLSQQKPDTAAASGSKSAPAEAAAQQLMKEFAQPAPLVKKVVKVREGTRWCSDQEVLSTLLGLLALWLQHLLLLQSAAES